MSDGVGKDGSVIVIHSNMACCYGLHMGLRDWQRNAAEKSDTLITAGLEQSRDSPDAVKVRRLLYLLIEAEKTRLALIVQSPSVFSDSAALKTSGISFYPSAFRLGSCFRFDKPVIQKFNQRYNSLLAEINDLLAEENWTPEACDQRLTGMTRQYSSSSSDAMQKWGVAAMSWLLRLADGDHKSAAPILNFIECAGCHVIFYKRTSNNLFCSLVCADRDRSVRPSRKDYDALTCGSLSSR